MLALRQAAPRALAGSRRTLAFAPAAHPTPPGWAPGAAARPAARPSIQRRFEGARWFSDGDDSGVAERIRGQLAAHFRVCPRPVCKRLGAALWVPTSGMRVLWAQDGTVEVEDVSGGCGSFMKVTVTSAEFANKPRVKQHRMVQEVIKKEVAALHGLNIITGVAE